MSLKYSTAPLRACSALIETPVQALVEQYLQYLIVERRLSAHTVAAYRRDLAHLLQYGAQQQLAVPSAWQEFHVRQLLARLHGGNGVHGKGLAPRSLQRVLSGWRRFFQWLGRQRLLVSNPAAAVRAPKTARKLPKTLDVDQMNRLLAIEGDGWHALRDRAMLELFYSSGLRLAELASLDIDALDLDGGLVRVIGKGNKERVLPVGRAAVSALRAWLAVRRQAWSPDCAERAVFVVEQGRRLGMRAIQARLKHYSLKQGMDEPVHPHMLRHAFASHVLESSGDLRAVQDMLGHANISTTQVYTHLDFQHLARVYDVAHPRAQKKSRDSTRIDGVTRVDAVLANDDARAEE